MRYRKILIINGNPDRNEFDRHIDSFVRELKKRGRQAGVFLLREMDIQYCTGCWTCWWKTPGVCMHRDDMPTVYKSVMASDLLLFATPVTTGFVSALLKRANERLILLIHPYIVLTEGECHHRGRYDRYPDMGLLLHKGADADDEDIRIITSIYRRNALNFKTTLRCVFLTDQPVTEACDAIDAL